MRYSFNRKKFIISMSIILTIVLVVIILLFTLFSLKSVSLSFRTETNVYSSEESQNNILENANIEFGKCVFFTHKTKLVSELEKNNPYLKIVNIETVFPSSYVIHCAEREEVVSFIFGEKFLICDSELKVLRISDTSPQVALSPVNITTDFEFKREITVGDFLQETDFDDAKLYYIAKNIFTSLQMNSRGNSETKALFKNIKFLLEEKDVYTAEYKVALEFTDYNGLTTKILDVENKLEEKFQKYFATFPKISPEKYTTHEVLIFANNSDGVVRVVLKEKN